MIHIRSSLTYSHYAASWTQIQAGVPYDAELGHIRIVYDAKHQGHGRLPWGSYDV